MTALRVLISSTIIAGWYLFQGTANSAMLPTEEEILGIQRLCGAGNIESASAKVKVDAAIKSWKEAAVTAETEVAKKDLIGALGQVKSDEYIGPVFQIYVDCVSKTIQQFMDNARFEPIKVSVTGSSAPLIRSNYTTDEQMQNEGCDQATQDARPKLTRMCGDKLISITSETCPKATGSPRTYTSTITATCKSGI
uniref:hypothetical protein n=1 Tax=Pseudomonas chlororaphis TaxID=587753 RepID=UPI0011CE8D68|nr:hypothetical protein [Pseudomonas chlororaphis]